VLEVAEPTPQHRVEVVDDSREAAAGLRPRLALERRQALLADQPTAGLEPVAEELEAVPRLSTVADARPVRVESKAVGGHPRRGVARGGQCLGNLTRMSLSMRGDCKWEPCRQPGSVSNRSSSRLRRNADGTACSMSLPVTTCDNIRRTLVGEHMSLQGMPASDWGGSSQRCRLREGSGHDRRRNKDLRSERTIWTEGALLFLPQLWNIPVLGS
jgi:hypothetical protein